MSTSELREEIWRLIHARQWNAAADKCRQLTAASPEETAGWYAASQAALGAGRSAEALACIERAMALDPQNPRLLLQHSRALAAHGRLIEAAAAAAAAHLRAPDNDAALLDGIGTALSQAGDLTRAMSAYDRAVTLAPHNAAFRFNRATVRRYLGALAEAESDYDRVITLNPRDFEAYKNRSDLRRQTPSSNHVTELEALLGSADVPWQGAVQLHYALAKEYEDLAEYATSFRHLRTGASLRRQHLRYDVSVDVATVDWIIEAFPRSGGERPQPQDTAHAAPVFVLGLPRSGSTLVERILASHSQLTSAGELPNFARCLVQAVQRQASAQDALGRKLPRRELVARSASLDFASLGDDYLKSARASGAAPGRFIDKMPLNYLYCGLIERSLPGARLVHVSRSPMAACYAMYKTLFRDGYPFSYDLTELGRYYLAYRRLMRHWHSASHQGIHRLSYERLVSDQGGQSRSLLQYCGLAWEDGCLQFHRNASPSRTASAAQIRQPIYESSVQQWRHYSEQLAGLAEQLRAGGLEPESAEAP